MSDVVVRVSGVCGRLTLNRPRTLNALTLAMVQSRADALVAWARDPCVHFVLLDGAGDRGLCAGGDIRAIYLALVAGDLGQAADFFRAEYELNYRIACYPKPFISLMDGLVMGGGIGVSSHASHRVVTERSELAMPEAAIGFIPDVGATYLLGTAPDESGTYLGLTGNRIGAADAVHCGLADIMVHSELLPALTSLLERCGSTEAMQDFLHSNATATPRAGLFAQNTWIQECFSAATVEQIMAALSEHPNPAAQAALHDLHMRSPTSLKLTLAALRNGRALHDLAACLQQEYRLALACARGHDFVEGVRAAIIDKDRKPAWRPDRLDAVTPADVERHFAPSHLAGLDLADGYTGN